MNRDPYYQRIVDQLASVTDDTLFEHCAADLLRSDWPNLVPVPGGDDAGLDGAWTDDEGRGLLVVTISPRVIQNVTKNLRKHLHEGGRLRRVLVATTQKLTARQCRNIENRVRELGFYLAHQPYTQQAIADRLYHDSRWCHELLGIAGGPSALSRTPKGLRPLRDLPLLHRQDDYQWIDSTSGDRIIVGHPGVGKTYLLQEYVNKGNALFVTDDDSTRVTIAIRDQQPTALIVEDAHRRLDLLQELRRHRVETGLNFDIVVDCWPAALDDVRHTLDVGSNNCRAIERLSPEQIVDVINAAGIPGPNWLVAELIRQSGGNPGRAAMLAHLCLTDSVENVWEGKALARWVRTTFSQLVDAGCIRVLAMFAFGGKDGMRVDTVARVLGYPVGQVLDWIVKLDFGGVVQDVGRDTFRVLPEPLRFVLVKEFFFDQPAPRSVDELLGCANSFASALRMLIGARARGAGISMHTLVELLKRSSSPGLWDAFVQIDAAHAHVVLDEFPDMIRDLARPLLHVVPDRTIPHLLRYAIDDSRPLHSTTDDPLRVIHDWIESAPQGTGESVRRRRTLWASVKEWLAGGNDWTVAGHALTSVLSPDYDHGELVAGKRMFSFVRGSVHPEELRDIAQLWSEVYETLKSVNSSDWVPIFAAIDQWVYWQHSLVPISDELRLIRNSTARKMLSDLRDLASNRPGIQKELQHRGNDIGLSLEFTIDREYVVLFPEEDFDVDWNERERQNAQDVQELAAEWVTGDPKDISVRLVRCVNEAKASGRMYPDYSEYLSSLIAAGTGDVLGWLTALMEAEAETHHVLPFVERAVSERPNGWSDRVVECLRSDGWRSAAVLALLKTGNVEAPLLENVFEASKGFPTLVERLCMSGQLVDERIARFLEAPDAALAEAAAKGLWHREPHGEIPEHMASVWRRAVVSHVSGEYDLCEMMKVDNTLSFHWMMDRATNGRNTFYREVKAVAAAADQLTDEERRTVIDNVDPEQYAANRIISALVGSSREMYEYLLSKKDLKRLHLAPLGRKPAAAWWELALVALDAGFTPREVASVAFEGESTFSWGTISSRREAQMRAWAETESHDDPRIREAARIGKESARRDYEFWETMEKTDEFNEYFD